METGTWRIEKADEPAAWARGEALFREYAAGLGFDLGFQGFDAELADLPALYGPPSGALLLAGSGEHAAGCVAVRDLGGGISEMKRLYVRPEHRGQGLGAQLARAAVAEARALGYERMRLDTLATMVAAMSLYESLGFRPIPAYRHNPLPGAAFYELVLRAGLPNPQGSP